MRMSNLSDCDIPESELDLLVKKKNLGDKIRQIIENAVRAEVSEQLWEFIKAQNERDIHLYHLLSQMDSMEKSVKDTNKKITAIRNQLRKEKGRGKLS